MALETTGIRRWFLKWVTFAIGGVAGLLVADSLRGLLLRSTSETQGLMDQAGRRERVSAQRNPAGNVR